MSKAVMTVISKLLDNRRSYKERDNRSVCAIKSIYLQEGRYSDTSFTFGTIENTNLIIRGFLAGLYRSSLTFLFAFLGFTDNS